MSSLNTDVSMPTFGSTREIQWRAADGTTIEGLLTTSPAGDRRPGPLALVIHGGPGTLTTQTFTGRSETYMVQALVAEGYAVLRPTPRGSLGYGRDFRYEVVGAWAAAAADLLSGVDAVIRQGVAHPDSLVVMGWGYGGYLAAILASRGGRFQAVSVGAPLADLTALALETDIPSYLTAHMGAEVWEDPGAYLDASLLPMLATIETPVQVMQGASDTRIPRIQGLSLHEALRRRGIETELLLFDGSSPDGAPDLLVSVQNALHRWLDRHLRPPPAAAPVRRPPPQQRRTSFIAGEYQPYATPGRGAIEGRAYLVMPDGTRRFCSRQLVFMNPVTTLSPEWYERNVLDREELEPLSPTSLPNRRHWITRADEDGRFRFVDLPAGEYYLGCRVLPAEGFAHGQVALAEDATAYVELVRHVPIGGDDPLRQEVSGPAEWGQLVGSWRCTLRQPDAQGVMSTSQATWVWQYVMGGIGVRDVYHGLDAEGIPRFRGGAIRVYNPETEAWEISWTDTAARSIRQYRATYRDGRMIMRIDGDPEWRTIFYDITATTFDWSNEPSGARMRCVTEG